jgi:hypothetical protein
MNRKDGGSRLLSSLLVFLLLLYDEKWNYTMDAVKIRTEYDFLSLTDVAVSPETPLCTPSSQLRIEKLCQSWD